MLTIERRTLHEFDATARPAFVGQLHQLLSDKYPHFLPRFPDNIGARIVDHMVQRGEREGLCQQRSLLAWCELMIIIASDFERHPAVRAILDKNYGRLDSLVPDLPVIIDDEVWERCEAGGSSLGFFHPPSLDATPLVARTAAAIQLVLEDKIGTQALDAAKRGLAVAARHRLSEVTDAGLVLAACHAFYPEVGSWFAEVLQENMPPRAKIEALRLRLALDFGRVV